MGVRTALGKLKVGLAAAAIVILSVVVGFLDSSIDELKTRE